MPNYSLRLRPMYDPNELTGGEHISRGIGSALDAYLAQSTAAREERNKVAAMGGTPVADAGNGPMARIRGIGGAIGRVLGRRPPAPMDPGDPIVQAGTGEPTEQGLQTGTDMARDGYGASRVTPPVFGAPAGQIDAKGRVAGTNRFPTAMQPGGTPSMETPPAGPGRQAWDERVPGISRPSFGEAIKPYIYEGQGGRNYSVDPLYATRVGVAGREMEADAAESRTIAGEQRRTATLRADQERQVGALTAAGMPENEARARVLTGTVRYDESFGQYRPNNGNLTFDERKQIEQMKEANALKVAAMRATGNTSSAEYRNAMLALQTANLILASGSARATGFEHVAAGADRGVPTNPIERVVAEGQPGGAARIATADSTANANRDSAAATRDRAAATADSIARNVVRVLPPGPVRPQGAPRDDTGSGGKPAFSTEQTRTRALQLKDQGKTKQQIYEIMRQEGYNIAPPKGP